MSIEIIVNNKERRSSDLQLRWLINHGKQWEVWRKLGEAWLKLQDQALDHKLTALNVFFEIYLIRNAPWAAELPVFFLGENGWKASNSDLKKIILANTKRSDNADTIVVMNNIARFIDWIIESQFSEQLENGKNLCVFKNPFEVMGVKRHNRETVYNALPYRYICKLREIICPKFRGSFSDWTWARNNNRSQWFQVDENKIDKLDKDCVWRRRIIQENSIKTHIFEIWSPVLSMFLFIKLHLPLRTFQIRMLDSGEADSYRYEDGKWIENPNRFKFLKYNKGVFRRFKDNFTQIESTGLYINTNKTSDQNKEEFSRGYEIPWQNEHVLFWLEKLRNWQEKYNPILSPTDCTTLKVKHTHQLKSKVYLESMGMICFLFRNAASSDLQERDKPIGSSAIASSWYKLLEKLEYDLKQSGDTLSDGTPLKLVHRHDEKSYDVKIATKTKTEFPLHSLRVSLITSYIVDAKVPLPVVSKLLAGHSRILMTIYYTKITPQMMREKMNEAEELLEQNSYQSLKTFLKETELNQVKNNLAYCDEETLDNALINRNPIGWESRYHGLCLAGGNTVRSYESTSLAGCWNGGELINNLDSKQKRTYSVVAHGLENCVRCRWFVTDARYLPMLNAHLNFMSFKAHEAANLSIQIEKEIEYLEESKYEAEIQSIPFLQHHELQSLYRRYEKQTVQADEFTQDWLATFRLIKRIIEIESVRDDDDQKNKLIAVGSKKDFDEIKVQFLETSSELLHLSLLCEDAEIYPDLLDEIKKTSVIEQRTLSLSKYLLNTSQIPKLLVLDKEHQLLASNAMIRQMVQQANSQDKLEGLMKVIRYLEMEEFLNDKKLLDGGIEKLDHYLTLNTKGIPLKSLSYKNDKRDKSNAR